MAVVRHAEKRRTSTCLFADRVATLSVEHYRKYVPSNYRETQKQTCLATIVAAHGSVDGTQRLSVIGMGVGTKFLSERILQSREERYGERIRDCHAEVLARRAFRRYLSEEIWRDLVEDKTPSILQRCQEKTSLYYKLRSSVTLHFYCSSAPCGNATLKKFATLKREIFRDDLSETTWPNEKHEYMPGHSISLGQFALLVKKDNSQNVNVVESELSPAAIKEAVMAKKESKWPANRSTDWCPPGTTTVWSNQGSLHTCSDKLCRWNCLGLQGSLLARWMDPLYIATLTVGRKLTAVTCRRAVCCRVGKDEDAEDGNPYRVNHPAVMGTAVYLDESGVIDMDKKVEGQHVRFHSSESWTWWPGLEQAECIDAATGYMMEEGSEGCSDCRLLSRLSTSALVGVFLDIVHAAMEVDSRDARHIENFRKQETLAELRDLKRRMSSQYEATKERLLTRHPLLRQWSRRGKHLEKEPVALSTNH